MVPWLSRLVENAVQAANILLKVDYNAFPTPAMLHQEHGFKTV